MHGVVLAVSARWQLELALTASVLCVEIADPNSLSKKYYRLHLVRTPNSKCTSAIIGRAHLCSFVLLCTMVCVARVGPQC